MYPAHSCNSGRHDTSRVRSVARRSRALNRRSIEAEDSLRSFLAGCFIGAALGIVVAVAIARTIGLAGSP